MSIQIPTIIPGFRKVEEPIREIIQRNPDSSLTSANKIAQWFITEMQDPKVELAMHRAKEAGGTMNDCMRAALAQALMDNFDITKPHRT